MSGRQPKDRLMRPMFALAMLLAAAPLPAQETRDFPVDAAAPPATLADMAFALGRWQGPGIEGHQAVENWLPPTGSTMVGTFIQTGESGHILFTEHMYLMEEDGSLVLRLKHFNPDLTGWEEKDAMTSFPLRAIAPCRADFAALTMRCDGENGLVVAVRMREADGSTGELVFRFARAG